MNSKLMGARYAAFPWRLAVIVIFASGLLLLNLHAMPRSPLPPIPEKAPIYHESFDENYFAGETDTALTIPNFGIFDQSWSGYALERTGDVIPFVVPALNGTGHTNITCDTGGALRLWIDPYWSSQSQAGGAGPGALSTVLEFDAVSGVGSELIWSLQTSADGNTLELVANSGTGLQQVLQSQISWQAGQPHLLTLNYSTEGTTLYVDNAVAASGSGLISLSPSVGELVIGSTIGGTNAANADIDEFYSFNFLLSSNDVRLYYSMTGNEAAMGPVSDEEILSHRQPRMESAMSPSRVFDPNTDTGCPTGGMPYLTNFSATLLTNNTTTVSFDLVGGTNGIFYDIYYLTDLTTFLDVSTWQWAGQGLTCNGYTFSNQLPDHAFYFVVPPVQPTVRAWGNNSSGQCNVPLGLTNALAVAGGFNFSVALRRDGTVTAWGDNTHGQTNVPSGLSNVVAIAAGHTHVVALLANGAVTNWGAYWDGGSNYYSATNYSAPTSNITAIAAGMYHDLALQSNGMVTNWGLYDSVVDTVTTNLTNVQAIDCGWYHNLALLSNGNIVAWGLNVPAFWPLTNVPANLTNTVVIAAGALHSIALRADGTVESWGWNANGETNIPSGLSNVVAVAAGSDQSVALCGDGRITAWGTSGFPEATVPTNLYGAKAIACGFSHNLAIASSTLPPIRTEPPIGFASSGNSFTFSVVGLYGTGFSYQWQFNGTNITGETNATLTLSGVNSSDNGSYQAMIYNASGSVTSLAASFAMALGPVINSTTPTAPSVNWINYPETLSIGATAVGQADFPLTYQWQFNGTNLAAATNSNYTISDLVATNEGKYNLTVSNSLGATNATWTEALAFPGMVEAFGDDSHGECDRPVTLTNTLSIAAGDYHSVAVTDSGTILQWGKYSDGTNVFAVGSPPSFTNVVAVAASLGHDLALNADGSVTNWGLTNDVANFVPTNLSPAKAIAAGWKHNVALLTNGSVVAWGDNSLGQTNVPGDLTNVLAVAAGEFHSIALRADGTVEAWGYNTNGQTNVPAGLSNVVAIAAGGKHSMALKSDGYVVAWGDDDHMQTNVPAAVSNIMAIAAGSAHSVALKNDGTLIAWGDNSSSQTNIPNEQPSTVITTTVSTNGTNGLMFFYQTNTYPPIIFKSIAAGGDHTMAAIFSPLVQYPVDVSKDLLLIYNTNSADSSNVCQYYLSHRPMVSNANVLGIGCTTNETFLPSDYANVFAPQIRAWLTTNQTKRPQYVILFQDIPSRVNLDTNTPPGLDTGSGEQPSVQYQLQQSAGANWRPFVTSINMNGTAGAGDCTAYIDKLVAMSSNTPGNLIISASRSGYGNTNWYFNDTTFATWALQADLGVAAADTTASIFYTNGTAIIGSGTNVAGYCSWGWNGGLGGAYAIDGTVVFTNHSGWFIIETDESFNGRRSVFQGHFLQWFSTNAFEGTNYGVSQTNYANTPIGAVTQVDEPGSAVNNPNVYFGLWAAGKPFACCAWNSFYGYGTPYIQVIGDPFTIK